MDATSTAVTPDRRYILVFGAQLVLTAAAVLVSRLGIGGRSGAVAVMLLAALNGVAVALFTMGLGRESRIVRWLALAVAVFALGLLGWPAWDVYERMRLF